MSTAWVHSCHAPPNGASSSPNAVTTQRLFVALDLPSAVKGQLKTLQTGVSGAKWVKPQQMHLTLRFVGDATVEQSKQLEMGLAEIKAAPFSFHLRGVGQFPPKGKARVLWVGIPPLEAISTLAALVDIAAYRPEAPDTNMVEQANKLLIRSDDTKHGEN